MRVGPDPADKLARETVFAFLDWVRKHPHRLMNPLSNPGISKLETLVAERLREANERVALAEARQRTAEKDAITEIRRIADVGGAIKRQAKEYGVSYLRWKEEAERLRRAVYRMRVLALKAEGSPGSILVEIAATAEGVLDTREGLANT